MNDPVIVECEDLEKSFHDGEQKVEVLAGLTLQVKAAEQVAIVGPSGAGKSTLLHVLGGLDKPSGGNVSIDGHSIWRLSEKKRSYLRNQKLGFVYQFHHLLPEFNALENVAMPLILGGLAAKKALEQADEILQEVGLSHRLTHKPAQLSGGERQRTAIARALVTKPKCLLADEPTGNLDRHTAEQVYEIMSRLNREFATSLIIVTHDLSLAAKMDRVLSLEDGKLQEPAIAE